VEQVSRTEMALRLVRWLNRPLPAAASFADAVNVYRRELSFVDWARESVCRGEDVAGAGAPPGWLGADVTGDPSYSNARLAS
jgi:hypothetical protein